jgi:hypothetical protein
MGNMLELCYMRGKRDKHIKLAYCAVATKAIKSELMAGRAVGISFFGDQSMPVQTAEEKRRSLEKSMKEVTVITDEEKKYCGMSGGWIYAC